MRTSRKVLWAGLGVTVAAAAGGIAIARHTPAVTITPLTVAGTPGPAGQRVSLAATLFTPAGGGPHPGVVLAHGFGSTQADERGEAITLARDGYVVLTYTARGFGTSGGQIGLDSPAEVADARRMVSLLAANRTVARDHHGPLIAIAGPSYGGALALLTGATDPQVRAVASSITWNSMQQMLFPQNASGPAADPSGVFTKAWAGALFATGGGGSCGRFTPQVCRAYTTAAVTGHITPAMAALMTAASPATYLRGLHVPTLLIQGESDSLVGLGQSLASARTLTAQGTPVTLVWYAGGHDAPGTDAGRVTAATLAFLNATLRGGAPLQPTFQMSLPASSFSQTDATAAPSVRGAPLAIALRPTTEPIAIAGPPQSISAPAGGAPAALTSLPGLGPVAAFTGASGAIPGQVATFASAPLARSLTIAGLPTATVTVRSTTGRATLFAAVEDLSPSTGASLPDALVAPLALTHIPASGTTVTVALPGIVRTIPAGDRLALVISTTDAGYLLPARPATYLVASGPSLTIPVPVTTVVGAPPARSRRLAASAGALATVLVLAVGVLRARRRRRDDLDLALADVPIATTGLGKRYRTGVRAVADVTVQVGAGQVVGLLGPNGAGKTSTLRMLVGLVSPSEGQVRIYGHLLRPGHPVLSRLGVLIEGPGLLPHLSGRQNLAAAWSASGRPDEQSQLETVLEVAGLADDIDRTVRTYSQGMRQRLAIAQAMLGLPDVLVLDEPTNGLDPQQIGEMRQMLRAYAASGRTVLVSSHLLAEVEATCTHVAVMSAGKLVASGTVADIVSRASTMVVDVADRDAARRTLERLGLRPTNTDTGLRVGLGDQPRSDVLASLIGAGIAVTRFAPEHGLEEAFLDLIGGN